MSQYPSLYMIIDGERVDGGHRRTHAVVNPATGEVIGQLPLADPADLDRALAVAAEGFRIWRDSTPQQRAAVLQGATAAEACALGAQVAARAIARRRAA